MFNYNWCLYRGIKRPIKVQPRKWKGRGRQRSFSRSVNALWLCNADLAALLRDYFSIAAIVSRFLCLRSPFAVASECINSSLRASEGNFHNNHVFVHSLRAPQTSKSRTGRSWQAFMVSERCWFNYGRGDSQMTSATAGCAIGQRKAFKCIEHVTIERSRCCGLCHTSSDESSGGVGRQKENAKIKRPSSGPDHWIISLWRDSRWGDETLCRLFSALRNCYPKFLSRPKFSGTPKSDSVFVNIGVTLVSQCWFLSKLIKWTKISIKKFIKNPRSSICIIKTRTCRGSTSRADENESFFPTKFGVWSFEKMRRRRAPRLISFSSRAPQQWGLLESWHNTSEQRLRTVYFCAGNGDRDGSVFFVSRERSAGNWKSFSFAARFDENKWKPFMPQFYDSLGLIGIRLG